MAAINDCLHRYRERSKFMTFTDLDEYIIPRSHKTWSQFINHVQSSNSRQSGFLFRTTIFRQEWTQPAQAYRGVADTYRSSILSHTQRENYTFKPRLRSKMIVDPKKVEEMGVYFAWRTSEKTYTVPETDGLVHSYRKALPKDQYTEDEWQRLSTPVTDLYVVETFGEKLAARLKEVWAKLPEMNQKEQKQKDSVDLQEQENQDIQKQEESTEAQQQAKNLDAHKQTDAQKQVERPDEHKEAESIDVQKDVENLNVRNEKESPHGAKTASVISKSESYHSFQMVEGVGSFLLVYAAIWEGTSVRIISIKKLDEPITNLLCVFWDSLDQTSTGVTVKANVSDLPESQGGKHTAAYITCPVPPESKGKPPVLVGLGKSKGASSKPEVTLPIEARNEPKPDGSGENAKVEFTLCVPTMFRYGNAAQLVEKLEMSRLLGVRRIVFFNLSVSDNVDAVLRMYMQDWSEGRESLEVVVNPWQLPRVPQEGQTKHLDIHYFGQMAGIDYCLHRYRRFTKYMIFSDLDEYLIPLQHANLSHLISELVKQDHLSKMFVFRSTVFDHGRPSPAQGYEAKAVQFGSSLLGFTWRDDFFYPARLRSKLIVDPTSVEEMGIHFVWRGSGSTVAIPVDVGMVGHYRHRLKGCRPQVKDTRVVDKFGKRLAARLKEVWSRLPDVPLGWDPLEKPAPSSC
ncbi:upf0392 protein f13g3.3-like isoform x2 [Plakobranchus ocellatus]|uniref:Upf0392 protein f13g3.3-like isoform x2 n=1 Tax=Plakobranchus ocellatus TaxID=259542 RepID=A0AAV4BH52_9GAST|nr:upf0392 protein f13g3.3-like isoform x2 [Plakobranchus ocellatus]